MSDDVWMPDELESLEEGSSYGFFINHDFLIPDLQSDVRFNKKAGRLENVYHGGEIRFHANDYPDKGDHSAVEIKKGEETENFDDFSYKLRNIRIAISESYPNFSTAGKLLRDSIYTSLESRLEKLAAKHPGFLQATAETRHMLLLYYHPAEVKLREQGEQMDSTEKKAFFGGKTFEVYKEQKMALLNNLEPSSILLEGKGAFYLHTLSEAVEHVPELISKNTNSEDFRYDFLKSFVVNSTNHRAVENVLTDIAFNYSYEGEKDKALFALTRIKNHYPESDFIKKGRYDRCMTAIKTVAGDQAPDFMLTTLKGDSIRLSAFKGKYVFIDFWGSWCNPCRKEIPHIKKLHASVSKDSLIILGIARDREESLRSFINNNEINYPNMMATEEVLNDYGIMGFPTTFLIDPEGVILEKNLRGKHLTNLIREKMKQS
jgi:peroxiredoxin